MIRFMRRIGLISTESDDYQFNAYYDNDNRCKTYRYYVENEKKIREYCIANKINTFIVQNNQAIKPYRKADELDAFPKSSVIFSSHLHLLKPENWNKKQFEDYLMEVLYENYPSLSYFQGMADDLNETYYKDYPEFQISYTPTFTWNKGKKRGGTAVTKIGIRATNALCSASTKSKEDAKENFCGQFKEDILQQYGLNLHKDVKSSVPRLTLSINSNGWVSEDIDIYEMIYKELVKTVDSGGYPFSEIREVIKALHMRTYFDSPGKLGVHTRRAMKNKMDISKVSDIMRIF